MQRPIESSQSQPPAPAPTRQPQPPPMRQGMARGPFVRVMTVFIVALVMAMLATIYWRDLKTPEPSCAVVLYGDQTLADAKVKVSGSSGHWETTMSAENNYQSSVLLEPGQYSVEVTHKGQVILNHRFVLDRFRIVSFVLDSGVALSAAPGAGPVRVTIEGQTANPRRDVTMSPLELDEQNHFHAITYLADGEYNATAWRNDRLYSAQSFRVEHGKPVELNFSRATNSD